MIKDEEITKDKALVREYREIITDRELQIGNLKRRITFIEMEKRVLQGLTTWRREHEKLLGLI